MYFDRVVAAAGVTGTTSPVFGHGGFGACLQWREPTAPVDLNWAYGHDDDEEEEEDEAEDMEVDDRALDVGVTAAACQLVVSDFGNPPSAVVGTTRLLFWGLIDLAIYPSRMSWTATSWEETWADGVMEWEFTLKPMDWEPTPEDECMGGCGFEG